MPPEGQRCRRVGVAGVAHFPWPGFAGGRWIDMGFCHFIERDPRQPSGGAALQNKLSGGPPRFNSEAGGTAASRAFT